MQKLFRSNVWLFHCFHLVLIIGCDSITQITPSHMLEFLLLSGFFGLFNPSLSLSLTHTHALTHLHALARTCSHSPFLLLSLFLQLSSCLKSSNGRQVDMLRLNIISAAWNKVRQTNARSSQATKSRINWRWSETGFCLMNGPGLKVRLSMNKSKASPGPSPERRKPFFLVQP